MAVTVRVNAVTGGEPWVRPIMEAAGQRVLTAAGRLAPRRTGALAGSHVLRVLTVGGAWVAQVTATAAHAMYVIGGRGPVVPVRARALRWVQGGQVVFSRYSRAVPPNPYLQAALGAVSSNIQSVSGYTTGGGRRVSGYLRSRPTR